MVLCCHMANQSPGTTVRSRREAVGLTREQLALKANTSTSTVERLERQDRIPNALAAARIASALDLSLDDLLSEVAATG